jgi:hypothetical protein
MRKTLVAAFAVSLTLSITAIAAARVTFSVGDNVYADGQWFTVEEYERYKATHPDGPPPAAVAATPVAATVAVAAPPSPPAPAAAPAPSVAFVNGAPVVTIAPPPVSAPLPVAAAAPVATATVPVQEAALRAASCKTTRPYAEFPGETDKFDCGPLGPMTRQEMLSQGWKIDFIEKLPAASGAAAESAYKIILSR